MPMASFFNKSFLFYNWGSSWRSHGLLFCRAVLLLMFCWHEWVLLSVFYFQPAKGKVVVWKGMQLKMSPCMCSLAISILSQLLYSAAAAKHLFPEPTLNSCSLHLSLMPHSDFHILFIPSCWLRVLRYIFSTCIVANVKYFIIQPVHRITLPWDEKTSSVTFDFHFLINSSLPHRLLTVRRPPCDQLTWVL